MKKKDALIFTIIFLFINCSLFAQLSLVTILDKETGEPVALATINIRNIESKSEKNGIASADGKLYIEVAGRSIISAFCMGYVPVNDTIFQDESKTLYLNKDVFNLEQVVVTGTRSEKTLKNVPVITQIVTSQQIEKKGFDDIKSLLSQEVPGLSFQEVGFGTTIQMQGLDAKHILILIDGERLSGETGNNIDYSRINLSNIERIEIVKGASSAIYGSQAMGGVINIITKNASAKFDIQLGGRYAQVNQINFQDKDTESNQYKFRKSVDLPNTNGNLTIGYNGGRLKSFTALQIKTTDAYQLYDTDSLIKYFPDLDTTFIENRVKTPFNISGMQDINLSQRINFKFSDKFDAAAKATFYQMNKYDLVGNNKYEQNADFTAGIYLNYNFGNQSMLSASFYTDRYNRYDKYELIEGKDLIYENNLVHPKIIFSTSRFRNQQITAGYEFLAESLITDMFDTNGLAKKKAWTSVLFAQDDWRVTDNLNFVAGVRADYHEQFKLKITPKLSALYRVSPFTFRFNYAKGYRSPTLKELYMNWDHLGMFWIYGNAALKPETNNYFSLSSEYFSPSFYFTISGYGNWFRNKIEGIWSENQTEYRYVNLSDAFLSGLDATAKLIIFKNFLLSGAFNYLYAAPTEGIQLSTASPLSGNIRFEYNIKRKDYNATLSLASSVYGAKSYDVEEEVTVKNITQKAFYKVNTDAYSIWNFTISQQFYNSVRITLGIDNLLNYKAGIINFNTSVTPGRRWFATINIDITTLMNNIK